MAGYGLRMVALRLAKELRQAGIAAKSLWPRTTIATVVVGNPLGGAQARAGARAPAIMSDAAHAGPVGDPCGCTRNFFIDEDLLAQEGVTDLDRYRAVPGTDRPETELFPRDAGV